MLNTSYTTKQSVQMLKMMGVNMVLLRMFNSIPEELIKKFGKDANFVFFGNEELFCRFPHSGMIRWEGPIPIDSFWMKKISQSVSFECSRYLRAIEDKHKMPNLRTLICRFNEFYPAIDPYIIIGS